MPNVRRRATSRAINSVDGDEVLGESSMLSVADSGVSPEDSFMVFIADAAKMEEKRASLAGIAAEVELADRQ